MNASSDFNNQDNLTRPAPLTANETWWVGMDRMAFYSMVRERQPMLSRRYGSAPVSVVHADPDSGFMTRVKNLRRAAQDERRGR